MADDVTPDADDADRTVTDDALAVSPEPDVDRDVPSAAADPAAHDPNVSIPPDEDLDALVPDPPERPAPRQIHDKTGPNRGVFRGHDVVEAERAAEEAALVAARHA